MIVQRSTRWVMACVSAVALMLSGCDLILKGRSVTDNSVLAAMRTHCLGRFLIDLPVDFYLTRGSDAELIYGLDKDFRTVKVEVPSRDGAQAEFVKLGRERSETLSSEHHFSSPGNSMLALEERLTDDLLLLRAYSSPDVTESFRTELFANTGTAVAIFSDDIYTGERPEDVEPRLKHIARSTKSFDQPETAGRGTCLGPVVIDAEQDGEIFTVSFRSKSLPDVVVAIDMNSLVAKSDGGLLKRWDDQAGLLQKLGFESTTLRRGRVSLGAMPGEELLSEGKDHDRVVRGFNAESLLLQPATFTTPSLAIEMRMGGQVGHAYRDASLSKEAALALWDAIVKSIRLRPGAV